MFTFFYHSSIGSFYPDLQEPASIEWSYCV
jgi:hypothetical protein